jgi:hypothetical protein
MLERLESRRLFAVSLTLDSAGVLGITGTSADENLQVSERANPSDPSGREFVIVQEINGVGYELGSVPESLVSRVVLDGQGGNDFLSCDTQGPIGANILGGGGNDQIQFLDEGSPAAPSIAHGGDGDDRLFILNGNGTDGASAYGDNGKDTLQSFEQVHTTYLYGGNSADGLTGTQLTVMDGGNGPDTIVG